MSASTTFSNSDSATVAKSIYYGQYSEYNSLKITRGNCLVSINFISGTYGDITISYTLYNDRETVCSMRLYYSTDDGTTFTEGTKGTGGNEKTSLSTTSAGTSYSFVWNSYTDVGKDFVGDVILKIRAYDRNNYIGDYTESQLKIVSISNAPSAPTLVTPIDSYFQKDDTPEFIFTIPSDNNPTSLYSKVHAKLEIDTTKDFNSDGLKVFESRLDQTGWEFVNDEGNWEQIPSDGIQLRPDIIGNQVRFILPTEDRVERDVVYWRVVFGGVTDEDGEYYVETGTVYNVMIQGTFSN